MFVVKRAANKKQPGRDIALRSALPVLLEKIRQNRLAKHKLTSMVDSKKSHAITMKQLE